MKSRVERNRRHRKHQRRIRLFFLLALVLVGISLLQVNRSHQQLVGYRENNQMIDYSKDEKFIEIILMGEKIQIPRQYIKQGEKTLKNIQSQIYNWINYAIEKASNN